MKNPRIPRSGLLFAALSVLLVLGACQNPIAEAAQAIKAAAATPTASITAPGGASLGSGASLDLGSVGLLSTKDVSLTVTNSGKTALVIDAAASRLTLGAGTEAGAITIVSLPSAIEPGNSGTVVLRLTRQATSGTKSATLVLKTNDVAHPDITLKVSGMSLAGTAKEITSFSIKTPAVFGNISGTTITVFVPSDTPNITMLVPEFVTTGSSVVIGAGIQKSGETIVDFSSEKTYTVTSLDGMSSQDYTVKVIKNPAAPSVVPHDKALEVSWDSVSDATGYEVWYYAGNTPSAAVKSGGVHAGTSASITGLSNGTTYYVWTKAVYADDSRSGLSMVSNAAKANIKTFGWLYTGYNAGGQLGVGKYAVSLSDGTLSGNNSLVSSDLAPSGSDGIRAMAVDKAHGFLFYAYRSSSNMSSAFMVRSAKIDPPTGNLIENPEMTTEAYFVGLTVSPDGKHLYGNTGLGAGRIFCWDVNQVDGRLENQRIVNDAYSASWFMGIAVHPSLNLLYITVFSGSPRGVLIYDINPATGDLTYRTTFSTTYYPRSLSFSPDGSRSFVSFSQDSGPPAQLLGMAAYDLNAGIPVSTTPVWTSTLGTTTAQWQTPLCVPVPGSSSASTILAFETLGNLNIRSTTADGAVTTVPSAGSYLTDADYATLPNGDRYIYASRNGGGIASYKVSTTPGLLGTRLDTGFGPGCYVVRTAVLPW